MAFGKRIWRIIKENKGRYIGIFILILIGSFYFIAATGIANNLEKMVVGFAEEYRQEDLTFSTDKPIKDIAALESESGTLIEAYRQYDVKLSNGQSLSGGELRLLSPLLPKSIPWRYCQGGRWKTLRIFYSIRIFARRKA